MAIQVEPQISTVSRYSAALLIPGALHGSSQQPATQLQMMMSVLDGTDKAANHRNVAPVAEFEFKPAGRQVFTMEIDFRAGGMAHAWLPTLSMGLSGDQGIDYTRQLEI